MDGLVALLVLLVLLVALAGALAALWWFAKRVRRRAGAGSLMGPFDQIWRPTAHHARVRAQEQDERTVTSPSPGDPLEQP
ncbi:hypothetical protein [Angustibacter luteus]|uniref:Secreted protein n=1 Tax=Angustibacter luteus TaxID=658456 RepID=A0ABW1JIT2_9ACTN